VPPPRARSVRRALPLWVILNVALSLVIAAGYVVAGAGQTWGAWGYAFLAFATAGLLVALAGAAFLAGLTFLPGGRALAVGLGAAGAALWLAFLWVDRAAFAVYRFHVGGLAWSALRMPGGLGELGVWPASPGWFVTAVAALALLQGLALLWLAQRVAARVGAGLPVHPGWRALLVAVLLTFTAERLAFTMAERSGRREVIRASRVVPFYPVLVGIDLARRWTATPAPSSAPPPAIAFAPDAPRWNVLWMVLDSWRADAMTPALTPVAEALGRRSSVFLDHTSGGDATRYGLVSMLYGLPASSWSRLQLERRSPPLLATLAARGWRLGVFTSVDMPDILSVIFADVPATARVVAPPARLGVKDRRTIRALEEFIARPDDRRPFFAFVHLLSTHWGYDPACRLPRTGRGPRERYDRAVRCADRLVARALRAVSLRDTIVVLTADHGEAFGEDGVHGHAAGFTLPQLRVPLVLHVPGRAPSVIGYPTTHHDLAATLLAALGAVTPSPGDGIGRSLFAGASPRPRFACNLNECAIHDGDGSVTFGVGARYPRELAIRDAGGATVPPDGAVGRRRFAQVLDLLALQRAALP
jgi:membrane-anchored protein YejM (alkaline phosphatase superfamily)